MQRRRRRWRSCTRASNSTRWHATTPRTRRGKVRIFGPSPPREPSSRRTLHAAGGSLGWKSKGSLDPKFEEIAFALEPSTTSSPKIGEAKTGFGYHIIMVRVPEDDNASQASLHSPTGRETEIVTSPDTECSALYTNLHVTSPGAGSQRFWLFVSLFLSFLCSCKMGQP